MGYGNLKGELELKYLKVIGNTSIDNYISGYYALNLPDKDGIIADWHPRQYWYSLKENDKIPLFNTNNIFGIEGIEFRTIGNFSLDKEKKYYIANHIRAIADLTVTLSDINELRGCTNDWLQGEGQILELYNLLLKIKHKDIDWFLKEEFPKYRIGGVFDERISKR